MGHVLDHDGCRLAYDIRGSGPPVVFIQGVGVHGDGWRPQVDGLSGRYRCLTFDNRGMGASQPLTGELTVERMAADAAALVKNQGWDAVHVVGHSLGGLVALRLALDGVVTVRSLSLLCTFARGRDAGRPTPRMVWVGTRTRIGTRRMRRRAFLELIYPPAALAALDRDALAAELAPLFGHDLGDHPPVVGLQLKAMKGYDATERLGELSGVPTLVVSGAHDIIAPPACGKAIMAGIPGARYDEWADASHGLPIQFAERMNALLLDHMGRAD